jgi:methionyl aminopeptidase
MITLKSPDEIAHMRRSGAIAGHILNAVRKRIGPGLTTRELDEFAAEEMARAGAQSAFLGYRGYPGNICISINDEVVHGIPGPRRIELGDIVSVDVGVNYQGYIGDTADTIAVGVTDWSVQQLVQSARDALTAGIAAARVGGRISDISHAVQSLVEARGFSVVRDFVGHGVGRKMHEEPQIPNFGPPGEGCKIRLGMTLAIEPMVNLGGYEVSVMPDKWTVRTRDRKPSAHCEHTVAVLEEGPVILTLVEGVNK